MFGCLSPRLTLRGLGFPFSLDLLKEFRRRGIIGVLRHQLALKGALEDGLAENIGLFESLVHDEVLSV